MRWGNGSEQWWFPLSSSCPLLVAVQCIYSYPIHFILWQMEHEFHTVGRRRWRVVAADVVAVDVSPQAGHSHHFSIRYNTERFMRIHVEIVKRAFNSWIAYVCACVCVSVYVRLRARSTVWKHDGVCVCLWRRCCRVKWATLSRTHTHTQDTNAQHSVCVMYPWW